MNLFNRRCGMQEPFYPGLVDGTYFISAGVGVIDVQNHTEVTKRVTNASSNYTIIPLQKEIALESGDIVSLKHSAASSPIWIRWKINNGSGTTIVNWTRMQKDQWYSVTLTNDAVMTALALQGSETTADYSFVLSMKINDDVIF